MLLQFLVCLLTLVTPDVGCSLPSECMEGLSNLCEVLHKTAIIRGKSHELAHLSHAPWHWKLRHRSNVALAGLESRRGNDVAQELHFLADKVAFTRLELETSLDQAL